MVSVIIPVYNVEKYIRECVNSVINQSYEDIEIILVDDGATDSSGVICDELEKENSNVKTIHKQNGGLSSARNEGIRAACGDYYFFLDSDDYIPEYIIECLVSATKKTGSELVVCQMERTSKRKTNFLEYDASIEGCEFTSDRALVRMLYCEGFSTSACGKLIKKELFEGIEFPDGKFSEDLFTIYKTVLRSNKVFFIPIIGYYYYYRDEGSIVVSRYDTKHIEAIDAVDNIKMDTIGMGVEVDKAISSQYLNVIYDIAARNPKREDLLDERILKPLRENRVSVLKNKKSPKRLRLFALLSFIGLNFAIKCVFVYNRFKWKFKKNM